MAREPNFYTTSEVARLYRVSTQAVRDWIAAGKLQAVRTPGGRRLLIPPDQVENAIKPARPKGSTSEGAGK
jgi:excisionase family DNA binding protein